MLPGRRYKPEDVWYLLVRGKWLILLPWVVASLGTVFVVRWIPDAYRSESTIQVVPQRVSENYVRAAVSSKIQERLPVISQQILSRTRLERIIQDFGLYAEDRKTELMEDIVKKMRAAINVAVVKGDAFQVTFVYGEPKTTMRVTERLASLFVEENLRDREVLAEGANQFLDSQLDDARRRLLDHEKKLEEYRRRYAGELPTQVPSNVQSMQSLQSRIQALGESVNRDRDRRLVVERQLADANAEAAVLTGSPVPARGAPTEAEQAALPAAAQLVAARNALQAMQVRLKPDHPDVRQMKLRIRELEKKAEDEALKTPVSPTGEITPTSPAEALRMNRVRDFKREIETLDRDISRKEDQQKQVQATIGDYQRRVDAAPTRESELVALNRDYETLQKIYTSLLSRGEEAKVAANLERRQIGEQFKVIDAARLPEKPFYPTRMNFYGAGVGAGLVLGLALVALIEFRDSSFRTDDDVVTVLALPVLASIPAIVTAAEKRAMRRVRLIAAAASLVVFASGGVVFALRSYIMAWFR